jgi:hypothetical protein
MEDEGFNDRDFGAHSRSFSTCSPTLRVSSRDSHARLTSGWLAGLYREGVEPSGSLRKVSDHMVIPLSCHPDATIVPPKSRVEDWRAGLGRSLCSPLSRSFVCECHSISTMPTFPVPATSNAVCGFPALRSPACFTSRVMGPILLGRLSTAVA